MNIVAASELLLADGLPAPSAESLAELLTDVFDDVSVEKTGVVVARSALSTFMFSPSASSTVDETYMENIHPLFVEDTELEAIGNHGASILIGATGVREVDNPEAAADFLSIYAEVLAYLSQEYQAVAAVMDGTVLGPAYLHMEALSVFPIGLVAPTWIWEGEDGVTAYTYGMKKLGLPEVQVENFQGKATEVYAAIREANQQLIFGSLEMEHRKTYWLVDPSVEAVTIRL